MYAVVTHFIGVVEWILEVLRHCCGIMLFYTVKFVTCIAFNKILIGQYSGRKHTHDDQTRRILGRGKPQFAGVT